MRWEGWWRREGVGTGCGVWGGGHRARGLKNLSVVCQPFAMPSLHGDTECWPLILQVLFERVNTGPLFRLMDRLRH